MKEYYILGTVFKRKVQLINNWHECRTDEWYFISIHRKFKRSNFEYFVCLLGFQLRFIKNK
jgi:hypothetical protein